MAGQMIPKPSDLKAAAQSAVDAAQSAVDAAQAVASGAMRIPPASVQLAAQVPDLIENLAVATERLNATIDRTERFMAMADPMFRTLDALLPQVEALVNTGNEVFRLLSNIPGVSKLNPFSSGNKPQDR
jgi:ABC-type transporter Mla subunit MlaD